MRPTLCATCACFNSQPPEGGWIRIDKFMAFQILFQLTAARRRLGDDFNGQIGINRFQLTAARRRLGLKLHSSCPYIVECLKNLHKYHDLSTSYP